MLHQELRRRLLFIANKVPSTKLEVMKFLCRDVIPIAEMEKIRGALPLFSALEKRGEISDGKLDFLVGILQQVSLDHLVLELGEVPPSPRPDILPNGRLLTECLGRIAQNLTADDVQRLSYVFADFLAVSTESVFTAVQLFQLMTQRQLVTPTHVTHLCQELENIGRRDMCDVLHSYLRNTNQANCDITHVTACLEQMRLSSFPPSSVPASTPFSVPGSTPSLGCGYIRQESDLIPNPSVPSHPFYPNGAYIPSPYPNGPYIPYPNGAYPGPSGLPYPSGIPDNVHPPGPFAPFPGPNDTPPPKPIGRCVEESAPLKLPADTPLRPAGQCWPVLPADTPLRPAGQCWPADTPGRQLSDDRLTIESHQEAIYMKNLELQQDRSSVQMLQEALARKDQDRSSVQMLQEALARKDQELQSLLREMSGNSQWAKMRQGVMTSCDPNDLYPMNKDPHGICMIINNHKFCHPTNEQLSHQDRVGAEVDQVNLIKLFEFLHYTVEVYENATSERMQELMLEVANRNHQPYDSFVCFILSHGEEGVIHGADCSPVNLRDLSGVMKVCPTLMGKPKMFFIQACRGEDDGKPIPVDPDIQSDPVNSARRSTIPDDTDFFFGYATVPGRAAYRSRRHGSWFVTEICRLFVQHAYSHTLMDIMIKVNESISKAYTQEDNKQCTEMVVRLRKQIHFFCLLSPPENDFGNRYMYNE